MPNTRTNDPQTSHEAAETVKNVTQTQQAILKLLTAQQMTDEQLFPAHVRKAELGLWAYASESGLRSRRCELVRVGMVIEVSRSKTKFGRNSIVWGIA